MNNDENNSNLPNLFDLTNLNSLSSINTQTNFNESHFNDAMINRLTNMITNRIINNSNSFFPLNNGYNVTDILQNSLYQKNPYKKVTSSKGLSELKTIKFKDCECDTKECSITQDKFKEGEEIIQLPCKHVFDKNAILTWLTEESNSCPVCRYELDSKEIIEKKEINSIESLDDVLSESNEVLTDSDDDMPSLEEEHQNEIQESREELYESSEQILSNINRIIRNIQFVNQPSRLRRQVSFNTDRDLQYALMASLHESQPCEEKSEEDFITHPDTQFDETFNSVLSDIDSDDDLNQVD